MVEFLSLFLGLVYGPQSLELTVVGPVAAVEVVLDGETVATLTAPPWKLELDLGETLQPHDLVAIARDAEGRELDRAQQWINMSLSNAGASLAFSTDERGSPESVALHWESIGATRLESLEMEFDGQPMAVDDPRQMPLPDHETSDFHYVGATVRFPGEQTDRLETDYGGARSLEISTELTAVAITADERSGVPAARKMRSWFVKDGRLLKIHGIDKGGADLIVVRGPGTQEIFDVLAVEARSAGLGPPRQSVVRRRLPPPQSDWDPAEFFAGETEDVAQRVRREGQRLAGLRQAMLLDPGTRLQLISPRSGSLSPRGIEPEMFGQSRDYAAQEGGLGWLALHESPMVPKPRIAEAVALAGIQAHSGNRRRVVLLILADEAEDDSDYSAAITRDYLRALRVPLVVWRFGSGVGHGEWPAAVRLGDPLRPRKLLRQIETAAEELRRDLRRQRIVWLEGRHLPQRVELDPAALGIRLAGS